MPTTYYTVINRQKWSNTLAFSVIGSAIVGKLGLTIEMMGDIYGCLVGNSGNIEGCGGI